MPDKMERPVSGMGTAVLKRTFDIVVAGTALLLSALPMALVAMAIRLHDRGPALYRQVRIGRDCRPFAMFKFRSMIADADKIGGYATATGDARITPIGRFIRRTSIDELPQLFNVLRGDMSIVGPRPDVPAQQPLYRPEQWRMRHRVRPGITGLAQATARSTATSDGRLELDLRYVRAVSIRTDITIILLTIRQLVAKTGN